MLPPFFISCAAHCAVENSCAVVNAIFKRILLPSFGSCFCSPLTLFVLMVTMDKKHLDETMSEKYQPVTHTAEDNAPLMTNPEIRTAYDALADKYAALEPLLKERMVRWCPRGY